MQSELVEYRQICRAGKKCEHLTEGFTSMAQPVFFLRRYLGKRPVKCGNEKDRIVAEAPRSARLVFDDAFDEVGNHCQDAATQGNGCNANKSRAAIISLFSFHFAQQLANPVRVGRIRPGVTSGMDPWCPPKGGHNKARIIGQDELGRESAVM